MPTLISIWQSMLAKLRFYHDGIEARILRQVLGECPREIRLSTEGVPVSPSYGTDLNSLPLSLSYLLDVERRSVAERKFILGDPPFSSIDDLDNMARLAIVDIPILINALRMANVAMTVAARSVP